MSLLLLYNQSSPNAIVFPTGVAATASPGTVSPTGKANATLTGVAATGAAGTVSPRGNANLTLAGLAATTGAGTIVPRVTDRSQLAGDVFYPAEIAAAERARRVRDYLQRRFDRQQAKALALLDRQLEEKLAGKAPIGGPGRAFLPGAKRPPQTLGPKPLHGPQRKRAVEPKAFPFLGAPSPLARGLETAARTTPLPPAPAALRQAKALAAAFATHTNHRQAAYDGALAQLAAHTKRPVADAHLLAKLAHF